MKIKIDELNILESTKLRSMDYDKFFGEMFLTDKQKKIRIKMAEALEVEILYILSLISVQNGLSSINWSNIRNRFKRAFESVIEPEYGIDDYMRKYIDKVSDDITRSTKEHLEDEYMTSYDRARLISENEVNSMMNHEDDEDAIEQGKKWKVWRTMEDEKVRHSHAEVNGMKIPIKEMFSVGNCKMLYPHDYINGDASQLINCRCSLEYK